MTDPLSIAAGTAGLISLGIQVCQSLVEFYKDYKYRDENVASIEKNLESLLNVFQNLEQALCGRQFTLNEQDVVKTINTSIGRCEEIIEELRRECEKLHKAKVGGVKGVIESAARRALYPFKKSTLERLNEDIDEIRQTITPSLQVLQLKVSQTLQDDTDEMKGLIDLVRANQISSDLRNWLNAPDATTEHDAACEKRHPGTGSWLITDCQFSDWLSQRNAALWLHGFAGSGKSVLCSTAIQSIQRYRHSNHKIGIAFFYFKFDDETKRDHSAMLKALLSQLSVQLNDDYADLIDLKQSCMHHAAPSYKLLDCFKTVVAKFERVFIVLDALDECPQGRPRNDVLDTLESIRNWTACGLNLLMTSRFLPDISESLDTPSIQKMTMLESKIDEDISSCIESKLMKDRGLQKWLPYKEKIRSALVIRAEGVFRWVDCQLQGLSTCPCSEYHLDKVLESLPSSLDETYERMLCNIAPFLFEEARRILTVLCFAARPLTVHELIDSVAVKIDASPGLHRKSRLHDATDLYHICPGLIQISPKAKKVWDTLGLVPYAEECHVHIAHFSVQEYLVSERIRFQQAAMFGLSSSAAHLEMAQICLAYLLDCGPSAARVQSHSQDEYPLAEFAARFWYVHYRKTSFADELLDERVTALFQQRDSLRAWKALHDPDKFFFGFRDRKDFLSMPDSESVYYASLLGLDRILQSILRTLGTSSHRERLGRDMSVKLVEIVNYQGGAHGNALHAAARSGNLTSAQLLIKEGANPNAIGPICFSPLLLAVREGHIQMASLLLELGADVNGPDTPLQEAISGGQIQAVRLLLEAEADINARDQWSHSDALQTAVQRRHYEIVELLLRNGADVNAKSGLYGNALHAACYCGDLRIAQMLLEKGANVNAEDGVHGTALKVACAHGETQTVQMLLKAGADIDIQGDYYDSALQVCSKQEQSQTSQGGHLNRTLQAAKCHGHIPSVREIIDEQSHVPLPEHVHTPTKYI